MAETIAIRLPSSGNKFCPVNKKTKGIFTSFNYYTIHKTM